MQLTNPPVSNPVKGGKDNSIYYVCPIDAKRKQIEAFMAFYKIALKAVSKTSDVLTPMHPCAKLLVMIDMSDKQFKHTIEADVKNLKTRIANVCVVVLSDLENEFFVTLMVQARVNDYLINPMEVLHSQVFIQKLRTFQECQLWEPNLLLELIRRYHCFLEKTIQSQQIIAKFSTKRATVFELLIQGKCAKAIEQYFEQHPVGIGEHGIRDHRRAIYKAFKVDKQVELLALLYGTLKK